MKKRIVFMGTPEFAVPSLEILHNDTRWDVVTVITATDKLGGRGKKEMLESAVKRKAVELGIRVLQPKNLKAPSFAEEYKSIQADLAVVVAFRMLPKVVLDIPTHGTINLHGSLLPKYRGAAPINWAIINGETETGLTTFIIEPKIDTGEILLQEKVKIFSHDTAGSLHNRMMYIGAALVQATVSHIFLGEIAARPQKSTEATQAPKIFHDDCQIDLNCSLHKIHDFVRGLSPYPGAWLMLGDKELKVYSTSLQKQSFQGPIGQLVSDNRRIWISDGQYCLYLEEVKLQGRRKMDTVDFLNGYQVGVTDQITILT